MTDHPEVCPHCGQAMPQKPRLYSRPPDQLNPRRVADRERAERESGVRYREIGDDRPTAFQPFR